MIIAIPSKGRPGKTPSLDVLKKTGLLFVPANEVESYLACGAKQVVGVPSNVLGITATRNWILDYAVEQKDPWVVFVDDDAKKLGWIELKKYTSKHHKMLDEGEWLEAWWRLFEVTEDMGYRAWGIATDGDPKSVYTYRPFIWHTYLTASCCGVRAETGIKFDESFRVKEDYELGLRCIKEDGGIVGARFFHWCNEHWTTQGGCRDYRTGMMEGEAIRKLMKLYPGLIRKVTRGGAEYSIEIDF